jgi:hypothetical protein
MVRPKRPESGPEAEKRNVVSLSLRVSPAVVAAIDAYGVKVQSIMPGLEVTRADAARTLLLFALKAEGFLDDAGKPTDAA